MAESFEGTREDRARERLDDLIREDLERAVEKEKNERQYVPLSKYIASFEPPDYLVDGILSTGRIYALTAMTGHLKTAIATYLGLAVGAGEPFANLEVKKSRVLYLSGENDEDQKQRTIATMSEYGLAPDDDYFTILAGAEAIGILRDEIPKELRLGGPVGLVIVDTSIAYFGGDDENGNVEMKAHASMFRDLSRNLGGATVLILCHPTKNPGKDNLVPRGGGGFLNEIDGNLTLWRVDEMVTLHWQGKFRGANFEPLTFRMKLVTLAGYTDTKGRPINSVVVLPLNEGEIVRLSMQTWEDENKLLYEMLRFPGQSMADIAKELGWLSSKGDPLKSKVSRVIAELAADGLARQERKKWILTDKGKDVAKELK
jgi:hypothetical protein